MQVKPGSSASPKSAFFLFCCFDMIQNFTQAGKKYSADIAKRGYTAGATRRPKKTGTCSLSRASQKAWDTSMLCITDAGQSAKSVAYKTQWTFANHTTTQPKTWANKSKTKTLSSLVHSQNRYTRQHSGSTEDLLLNIFNHCRLCPLLLFINYLGLQKQKPHYILRQCCSNHDIAHEKPTS